jgi:O-antigen/teichoic acid export membrane protein
VKKPPESHFQTDHLLKNLGQRAVSGGFVTATAQAVKFGTNLASAIVLARLLSPHDFGLVAMAGAVMPILRTFREGGLSTATVQKEGITHAQVSNLFWINLALGGLITAFGAALAPAVAWFYGDERLVVVTVLLSLSFVLSGAAVQHLALLNRQMRFKAVAFIDIASSTLGLLVGIFMAWSGFGYWSLVGMQLSVTVGEVVLTWLASGWLPQLPQRRSGTTPLLRFGASMTVYILLRRMAGSIDVILLGRFAGAEAVGLYSRALVLLLRPLDQFIAPFDTVFIPMLSRLQNQPERYRQVFLQVYGAIALLSFGFAGLLMGLSEPLVLLLLGPNWTAVIPIFSWLTIAALYIPLSYAAMWLLTTQGRSRDLMTMGVFITVLTVISVAAGLPLGPVGLAMSISLMGLFVRLPVQYHITGKSGPVSRGDLWGVFFRHLPLAGAVGVSTWLVQRATSSLSLLSQATLAGLAGVTVGAIVVAVLPGLRAEVAFILEQTRRFLERRKAPPAEPGAA